MLESWEVEMAFISLLGDLRLLAMEFKLPETV